MDFLLPAALVAGLLTLLALRVEAWRATIWVRARLPDAAYAETCLQQALDGPAAGTPSSGAVGSQDLSGAAVSASGVAPTCGPV